MKPDWEKVKPVLKRATKIFMVAGAVVSAVAAALTAHRESESDDIEYSGTDHRYVVQMVDADTAEILETIDDEIFSTYEDAALYARECSGNWGVGVEIAEDRNEAYDPREVDFIVNEIDR